MIPEFELFFLSETSVSWPFLVTTVQVIMESLLLLLLLFLFDLNFEHFDGKNI